MLKTNQPYKGATTMAKGAITIRDKDQQVPEVYLQSQQKEFPNTVGYAYCEGDFVKFDAFVSDDKPDSLLETIKADLEVLKDTNVIFYQGSDVLPERTLSAQPFVLLGNEDEAKNNKAKLVCFIGGNEKSFEDWADTDGNTPEYHFTHAFLKPRLEHIHNLVDGNWLKIIAHVSSSAFRDEVGEHVGDNGCIVFLFFDGQTFRMNRKDEDGVQFSWGWASQSPKYRESPKQEVKKDDTPKEKTKEERISEAKARREAREKKLPDGVHAVPDTGKPSPLMEDLKNATAITTMGISPDTMIYPDIGARLSNKMIRAFYESICGNVPNGAELAVEHPEKAIGIKFHNCNRKIKECQTLAQLQELLKKRNGTLDKPVAKIKDTNDGKAPLPSSVDEVPIIKADDKEKAGGFFKSIDIKSRTIGNMEDLDSAEKQWPSFYEQMGIDPTATKVEYAQILKFVKSQPAALVAQWLWTDHLVALRAALSKQKIVEQLKDDISKNVELTREQRIEQARARRAARAM